MSPGIAAPLGRMRWKQVATFGAGEGFSTLQVAVAQETGGRDEGREPPLCWATGTSPSWEPEWCHLVQMFRQERLRLEFTRKRSPAQTVTFTPTCVHFVFVLHSPLCQGLCGPPGQTAALPSGATQVVRKAAEEACRRGARGCSPEGAARPAPGAPEPFVPPRPGPENWACGHYPGTHSNPNMGL